MSKAKWKEAYIITAYELRRAGYSKRKVAQSIGVTPTALQYWFNTKPLFKRAVIKGHKMYKAKQESSFVDYVGGCLNKDVQKLWKKIKKAHKNKLSVEQIKALCKEKGTKTQQLFYLHALITTNFKITKALKLASVSFYTYKRWQEDESFVQLSQEIEWHRGNFYEDALADLVAVRDSQVVKAVNETFNSNRGYGRQVQMKVDQEIITKQQFDFSNMPLELQRELLRWHREKKHVESTVVETQSPRPQVISKQLPPPEKRPKSRRKSME